MAACRGGVKQTFAKSGVTTSWFAAELDSPEASTLLQVHISEAVTSVCLEPICTPEHLGQL